MPIYTYACSKCKTEMDVVRKMSESDAAPDASESPKTEKCPTAKHKWTKIIKYAPDKAYGPGWRTRKGEHGNW